MQNKVITKRKVYFINPRFQAIVIIFFTSLGLLTSLLYYLANRMVFNRFVAEGVQLNLPKDHAFFVFIAEQRSTFEVFFFSSSIFCLALFVIGGLLISHKIAGPLYRLKKELTVMEQNKKAHHLNFRDNDFFQEIPEQFNKFIDSLDKPKQ